MSTVLELRPHHHRLARLHADGRLHRARVDRWRLAGDEVAGVADLGLDFQRDEPPGVDMRSDLQQHAGIDVLRGGRDDVGGAADDALLADGNLVAGLDRRLLVVERGEVRVRDHLGVAVGVEQAEFF